MNGSWSQESGRQTQQPGHSAGLILLVARAMADAGRARAEGVPSYDTMRWLVALSRLPAFRDAGGDLPANTDALALGLAQLTLAAGSGPVADLMVGAMRALPLDTPEGASLFPEVLALLLGAVVPEEDAVRRVVQGLEAATGRIDRRGPDGLGMRFLVMALQLSLAIRLGAPVAMLARQLHDLGTLAGRGAGAMLTDLDLAEEQEERIRAMLNDPAFAMRLHYLVPRRAMSAADASSVRKDFARDDRLAEQARAKLEEATATVARLRAEIDSLQEMERILQDEAAVVLLRR